jgi:alpha-L-fucosidase
MMTRRDFVKTGTALLAGAGWGPYLSLGTDNAAGRRIVLPTAAQRTWQDCEVGVLYSFDLAIAAGDTTENNASRKRWDPNLYQPGRLNTDQWLAAAKAAGAGYAVFTATHFNGFMQWQSDLYPYGLKQTSWREGRGDVVGDFVTSCRKAGILPGLYFSTHRNVFWQVWGHYVDWGRGRGTPAQEKFNRIAEKMTEELCSRYGALVQLWFDAGVKTPAEGGPDVLPIFDKQQPNSVFYHSAARGDHRWIGNESGFADYSCWATMPDKGQTLLHAGAEAGRRLLGSGDADGTAWSPGMVDVPMRGANGIHNWFWSPGQERAVQPTDVLVRMYQESVGRNCNFVLGAVIQPDGTLPEPDARRLAEFGAAIRRRYGKPVAETSGAGSAVELKLPVPAKLDAIIAMEDIALGERVREYVLEGRGLEGDWVSLGMGRNIGHKRIQHFVRRELAAVRLRFTRSIAEPKIRRLAVFDAAGGG